MRFILLPCFCDTLIFTNHIGGIWIIMSEEEFENRMDFLETLAVNFRELNEKLQNVATEESEV